MSVWGDGVGCAIFSTGTDRKPSTNGRVGADGVAVGFPFPKEGIAGWGDLGDVTGVGVARLFVVDGS